jgi:hypothetical protein
MPVGRIAFMLFMVLMEDVYDSPQIKKGTKIKLLIYS